MKEKAKKTEIIRGVETKAKLKRWNRHNTVRVGAGVKYLENNA